MNKKYIIDNHTHLNLEPLYDNWQELAEICKQKHMFLNLVSTEPENTIKAIEIARKTKIAKVLIAIHPTDIDKYEINEVEKQFDSFYEENKDLIIGIGECGLDKKHPEEYPDFEKQVKWLKWHAKYANKLNLPIMLHIRMAYKDLIERWDEFNFQTQVIIHCFCGNKEEAQALLDKGCYISFAGVVTHKKAALEFANESIKTVPLDRIFVETDAPFLTPAEYRKKTNINLPFYIFETYDYICKIKNISFDELVDAVNENYKKAYNLKEFGY